MGPCRLDAPTSTATAPRNSSSASATTSTKRNTERGVRIYKALDDTGAKWARHILDNGGIAVEDLTIGDLNGDGRIDIIAVGRATKNIRIYWNAGGKK